jgi:hypothetical protein
MLFASTYLYGLFLNYFHERLKAEKEETSESYRCPKQVRQSNQGKTLWIL